MPKVYLISKGYYTYIRQQYNSDKKGLYYGTDDTMDLTKWVKPYLNTGMGLLWTGANCLAVCQNTVRLIGD